MPNAGKLQMQRLTHGEARDAELLHWSRLSMRERLEAFWRLADDHSSLPGSHVHPNPTRSTLQRIPRSHRPE